MVASDALLLCIHSKQILKKISEALQSSFKLIIENKPHCLGNLLATKVALCIIDDTCFRNGGQEFLKEIRNHNPLIGRIIIARRMKGKEMKKAVNESHVYAVWNAEDIDDNFADTVKAAIRERQDRLDVLTRPKEFQSLKDEKENLIDAFNHEVRGAIAPIQLSLRSIKQELSSKKSITAYQRIDNKLLRLSKIIDRLLSFQSLERGKFLFQVEEIKLAEVLNGVIDSARFFIQEEGRTLEITTDIPEGWTVIFDELILSLSLEELVQNAVKYTPDHSTIHISLLREQEHYRIVVQDQGIGLNESELQSVWEVGYENLRRENRSSGYYRFRSSGVGLGLSLVRKYLAILGGESTIKSEGKCPAVPICLPGECPLTGQPESKCEEMIRIQCKYICPGDTNDCELINRKLGKGWCPGSSVTITIPR